MSQRSTRIGTRQFATSHRCETVFLPRIQKRVLLIAFINLADLPSLFLWKSNYLIEQPFYKVLIIKSSKTTNQLSCFIRFLNCLDYWNLYSYNDLVRNYCDFILCDGTSLYVSLPFQSYQAVAFSLVSVDFLHTWFVLFGILWISMFCFLHVTLFTWSDLWK